MQPSNWIHLPQKNGVNIPSKYLKFHHPEDAYFTHQENACLLYIDLGDTVDGWNLKQPPGMVLKP